MSRIIPRLKQTIEEILYMAGPTSISSYLETAWHGTCDCGGNLYLDMEDGPGWKCLLCSRKTFIKVKKRNWRADEEAQEREPALTSNG